MKNGLEWRPIAQLNRTDADISLYFLHLGQVIFYSTVDDPWFSAHKPFEGFWTPDYVSSVLGCTEQVQICSATDQKQCTILGPRYQLDEIMLRGGGPPLNKVQLLTAFIFLQNLGHMTIADTLTGRKGSILRAQEKISSAISQTLPDNQWHIEMSHRMAISMAKLQKAFVDTAAVRDDLPPGVIIRGVYNNDTEKVIPLIICGNQKIRHSGDHMSFSVLGMSIILILGGVIMIISLSIDTVVGAIQQRTGKGEYRRQEWILHDKLQLLRRANERAGRGTRAGSYETVPVTESGQPLTDLAVDEARGDVEYQDHNSVATTP